MAVRALSRLEYPRHVHQVGADGALVQPPVCRLVRSAHEADEAQCDGWVVIPPAGFVDDPAPTMTTEDAASEPAPVKRGPGRPRKEG